jgi:hypothetical protein
MKGHTNNPSGRKKGIPNKATASTREFLVKLLESQHDQIVEDFSYLEPYQRLTIIEKFLAYTTPKMASLDASVSVDKLTEEQIDEIFKKLIEANEKI